MNFNGYTVINGKQGEPYIFVIYHKNHNTILTIIKITSNSHIESKITQQGRHEYFGRNQHRDSGIFKVLIFHLQH